MIKMLNTLLLYTVLSACTQETIEKNIVQEALPEIWIKNRMYYVDLTEKSISV